MRRLEAPVLLWRPVAYAICKHFDVIAVRYLHSISSRRRATVVRLRHPPRPGHPRAQPCRSVRNATYYGFVPLKMVLNG